MDTTPTTPLPFESATQSAIIAHALRSPRFLAATRDRIKGSVFLDPYHGQVWDAVVAYAAQYGRAPTPEELLEHRPIRNADETDRKRIRGALAQAEREAERYGADFLLGACAIG